MQKFRKFFTGILVCLSLFSSFFPVFASIQIIDKYDYSQYIDKINISSGEGVISSVIRFDSPRTSFILEFDGYTPSSAEDIDVEWISEGKSYHRHLDIDNEVEIGSTTFPFVTTPQSSIEYKISFHTEKRPTSITLISSNQSSTGKKIILSPDINPLYADAGVRIISRSEWGADESLRYVPTWKRDAARAEWEARGRTPKIVEESASARERRIRGESEYNALISEDNDANSVVRLLRFEGQNKLIFPIREAKKINRIFLHHTAEGLDQNADDATLVRAIYLYHAKSKGWGDIGYNYIIGQRGVIYEGRAGGDYVEGAHVYANNLGTVGISVIGNYQYLHLNRDQREGLVSAIAYVAQKYGINVDEQTSGIQTCGTKESCIWKRTTTYRLAGHRDAGSTSCPGDNIYRLLPELRNEVVGKVGKVSSIYNSDIPYRDSIDPEDETQLVLSGEGYASSSSIISNISVARISPPSKSLGGKIIKVRLSYPNDTLTFASATDKKAVVRLQNKMLSFPKGGNGTVTLSGATEVAIRIGNRQYSGKSISVSSDVVTIPSWVRIPAWDSAKKYNDNLFRGKITITNANGKILVINELPIEDYLKGLGEVSDGDIPDKIKTIIVAARGYAHFYTRKENRKYATLQYDGSDNPDEFQKYLGYGYEMRSPNVSKLVEATKGQVITYNEKLIKPFYFSSSDGKTRSYKQYCEGNNPGKTCEDIAYLQSVDDPAAVGKVRSGHGVGISGIGSTYFASAGKNYKQIIGYYMSGTLIRNVNTLK